MCNARRHPPGCECGFGPPYPSPVSFGAAVEWAEEIIDEPRLIRTGLTDLAWDDQSIQQFIDAYREIRNSDLPRRTMVFRIKQLLGLRRMVEEEAWEEWIRVPLYQFSAPPVAGAVVEYSEGHSFTGGAGWSLKVFGIGTGDSRELQVTQTRTFTADGGACKEVFVPVRLRVAKVAVYKQGVLLGRGIQAEVAAPRDNADKYLRRRGCRSLPRRTCVEGPPDYYDTVECWLSGDATGSVHREHKSWDADVAREVSIHLANYVDVSTLVKIRRTRRLSLGFELPAGHDYRGYLCHGVLWWDSPNGGTAVR